MSEEEPLSEEEFRAAMLEFTAVSHLRKQLEAANSYISELRKQLCDQTAAKIAEVNYGYREATTPNHGWCTSEDLPFSQLTTFRKTNTDALIVSMYVANEEARHPDHRARYEQAIKQQLMDQLWTEIQGRKLIRQSERKVGHEVVYTVSLEVAVMRGGG